jgi:DNA-binding response OmpR family regulator
MPNILIIEDDEATRRFYERTLSHLGVIEEVESVNAALPLLDERPYDAIVLDLNLSGSDGRSVLRYLTAGGPNARTPTLVVSCNVAPDVYELGRGRPCFFVDKPVHLRTLVNLVAGIMGRDPRTGGHNDVAMAEAVAS